MSPSVTCPHCGKQTDPALKWCEECGQPWESPRTKKSADWSTWDCLTAGAPVDYDPQVIRKYAAHLCTMARFQLAICVLLGVAAGGFVLYASREASEPGPLGWVALFVLTAAGYVVGLSRAFALKLQAHTALCQVEIEKNTGSG